jgi:aquaporin Z
MIEALKKNWKVYLIEGWALGTFMVSACLVVTLIEHPAFHFADLVPSPFWRRMCIGMAMGLTAVSLIYSGWGKKSGAHMNPSVTLANYQLDRISLPDAVWYILAQCLGSAVCVGLMKWLLYSYVSAPKVHYVITRPGMAGEGIAFLAEFFLAFLMFSTVLVVSNSKLVRYTGYFAGVLVFLFIWLEAPLSGMSLNPARSLGSALAGNDWTGFWIYLTAPVGGMQAAAFLYRKWYLNVMGE